MKRARLATAAIVAVVLSGCGSHTPLLPSAGSGAATAMHVSAAGPAARGGAGSVDLSVDLPSASLPDFTHAFDNYKGRSGAYRPLAGSPKQYIVEGIFYEGYAGSEVIANTITIDAPKKGGIKTNMEFSPVPVANNMWALLQFYIPEANGSNIYVGSLATFVNHSKGKTVVARVDTQSTLIFQAMMALINAGLVDAQDLRSDSRLTTTITAAIKGLKPNTSTGLFSAQTIAQFVTAQTPKFRRTLTIKGAPAASVISVASDVMNTAENYLTANSGNFLASGVGTGARPDGSPCVGTVPLHQPGSNPTPPPTICVAIYGTSSGSITLPVFGDTLKIGASTGAIPYQGVLQDIAARAPGSKTTVKLAKMHATQQNIPTTDPFDWAFGTAPALQTANGNNPDLLPYKVTSNFYPGWTFGKTSPVQFSVPADYSKRHTSVAVNTWTPYGLSPFAFNLCTAWNACRPLESKGAFAIDPPFADPGTDANYYKWKGTNQSTIEVIANCPGYTITPRKGLAGAVTAAGGFLLANQTLVFQFAHSPGSCGNIPPVGTTVAVHAVAADGTPYGGVAVSTAAFPALVPVVMNTYQSTKFKSLSFTLKIPNGGSTAINLGTIRSSFTP